VGTGHERASHASGRELRRLSVHSTGANLPPVLPLSADL
jgi:hypothetical protein